MATSRQGTSANVLDFFSQTLLRYVCNMYVYAFIKNTHTPETKWIYFMQQYVNGFFCVETPLVIAFPMKRPGEREVLLLLLAPRQRMLGPQDFEGRSHFQRPEPKVECNNSDHPREPSSSLSLLFCVIILVFNLNLQKK